MLRSSVGPRLLVLLLLLLQIAVHVAASCRVKPALLRSHKQPGHGQIYCWPRHKVTTPQQHLRLPAGIALLLLLLLQYSFMLLASIMQFVLLLLLLLLQNGLMLLLLRLLAVSCCAQERHLAVAQHPYCICSLACNACSQAGQQTKASDLVMFIV
jgi:hypothetical protein